MGEAQGVARKGAGDVETVRVGLRESLVNCHLTFCGGCLGRVNIEAFGRRLTLFAYHFLVPEDMVVVLGKAVGLITDVLKESAGGCIRREL